MEGTAWAGVRGATGDHTQVAEFVRGDVVGEISLVTNETRTADVVARTLVRVLVLPGDDFHDLAHRYPELQVLMTEVVADRLGQTTYDGLGGKDIHGYRINRCVGRGGMGVVYEALRLSDGEVVAVKMMSHKLVYQPDALLRFRREAATLEALHHEVIASLYDRFSAYKTQFLVMEFCKGRVLKQVFSAHGALDAQAGPPPRAGRRCSPVARA